MKHTDRRTFLKIGSYALGGLALGSLAAPLYSCGDQNKGDSGQNAQTAEAESSRLRLNIDTFGIQLWTVKEAMSSDPKGTLEKLAGYGYKQIENFEGQQGIWWGMSAKEFGSYIDSLGMKLVASHCNMKENLEQKAAEAAEIGLTYLIDPYEGPQSGLDAYKRLASQFNEYAKICHEAGLRFAYHNHDYSFQEVEGQLPHTIFLNETDPELVDFEMDIYWVVTAGQDPHKWLKDYQGRWKLCHVKDRMRDVASSETNASTALGTGSIDYASILQTAKTNGMEYFIVEQERFDGTNPLESSEKNAKYMRNA